MIRRFADDDGKLLELFKPSLRVGTRHRSPRGILFIDNYYLDLVSNLDEDLLTPIEQKFALYYPSIVDQDQPAELSGEGGNALVDWIASMLCRIQAFICLAQAIAQTENANITELVSHVANVFRTQRYLQWRGILTRSKFRWGITVFPEGCSIVLTDNPVCQTNDLGQGGMLLLVPLSRRMILYGGHQQAINHARSFELGQVNAFLGAFAGKSIFAAERATLEAVKRTLEGHGDYGTDRWCEAARKPYFGCAERIQRTKFPDRQSISIWWQQLEANYGDPLFDQ